MPSLGELETLLKGDGDLRQRIVRSLGSYTVALFAIYDTSPAKPLELAGTGTLAIVGNYYGILTAAHVWEEVLKQAAKVGITLRDNARHRHTIPVETIVPTVLKAEAPEWNKLGPDVVFLRIPNELVGAIQAFHVFEHLERPVKNLSLNCLECWVAMGTPKELGTFTGSYASVEIAGDFVGPQYTAGNPDYYDFEVDTTRPGMPKHFGGFSGGGLWRVLVFSSPETGKVDWAQRLRGVIYWQSGLKDGRRIIRCNGPETVAALIAKTRA